jgi:hypothetical protein
MPLTEYAKKIAQQTSTRKQDNTMKLPIRLSGKAQKSGYMTRRRPGSLVLAAAFACGLSTQLAEAAPATTTKTSTAQGIMVKLDAAGTFAIVQTDTYKYNHASAAACFTNAWDGLEPAASLSTKTTSVTVVSDVPAIVEAACTPALAAPAAPAADGSVLVKDGHPGNNDVVGENKCNFLDGAALTGATYSQVATVTASCSYVSSSVLITGGKPTNIGKYNVTTTTIATIATYTYTYQVTPVAASYPALTAWDFVGSTGGDTALVSVNANIAGESVQSTAKVPRKYSFSLGEDLTGRISRITALTVTVDGVVVATPGSTVFANADFEYVTNSGSNGTTSLLVNGDARTILNTDSFAGNNNGGVDGKALALAMMDTVDLELTPGDHTITLTGTIKGNTGELGLAVNVTQLITIVTPGCGGL